MASDGVKLDDHFGDLAAALPDLLSQAVRKGALDAEAAVKRHAPVDTGNLRASVYTVTKEGGSTYPGDAKSDLAPQITDAADQTTAWVAVAASYGVYVELGTRHMAAQAFFAPGFDDARPGWEAAIAAIGKAMEKYAVK